VAREGMGIDVPAPANSRVSLRTLPPRVYQFDLTMRHRCTTGTLDLTIAPGRLRTAHSTVAAVRR